MARALLIAIALLLVPAEAAAQAACASYSEISERLAKKYEERVAGRGVDAQNRMFEIWAGGEGWTILMTSPDMRSCVMAIGLKGTTWEVMPVVGKRAKGGN